MRKQIFMSILGLLIFALPASAATKFTQPTLAEFTKRWNIAAERDAKDLGIDPIYAIQSIEGSDKDAIIRLLDKDIQVSLDVRKGVVTGFSITHSFKKDSNFLGFKDVSDIAIESFTPFWKAEQRENFMKQKMRQSTWNKRADAVIKGEESKWFALYTCSPAPKVMEESFGAKVKGQGW